MFEGGCRCGNLRVRLELTQPPEAYTARRCLCSYCTERGVLYISDPNGLYEITVSNEAALDRQRFGTTTLMSFEGFDVSQNGPHDWGDWVKDKNVRVCEYWRKVPMMRTIVRFQDGYTVDATGLNCPLPLLKARKALASAVQGCIVTILYDGDSADQAERYLIGHMEEKPNDPTVSVMSPKSPLGAALLGASAGEKVKYQAPNGMLAVKVVSVEAGS